MTTIWQTCKVFVSSTFKDLELARDRLAQMFRNVEKNMLDRQVTIMPYDLRWRDRHSTEPIAQWCIKMVKGCAYFIGILAYRYGWRPPLDGYGHPNTKNMSVTEMEIREALQSVAPQCRFFCFADENIPPDAQETQEDLASLAALKNELRERGEKIMVYHDIPELLAYIQKEFQSQLDAQFPPGQKAETLAYTYQDALREMIAEKIRGFVGRGQYLNQLQQFAQATDGNNYLGIHAVAGTGKSSLLAQFIHHWQSQVSCNVPQSTQKSFGTSQPMQTLHDNVIQQEHPTTPNLPAEVPVVAHFLSMGGDAREVHGVFRSLAEQLQALHFFNEPLPTAPDELQTLVRTTLEQTQRRCVLVLDGLDEVSENGQNLVWLPKFLPPQIRVILTTRPVETWEKLQKFPHLQPLELPRMEESEVKTIIAAYVQDKKLSLSTTDQILLQNNAAGNPLFLKVALDEITASGIAVGQLKTSVEGLFEQILERLEKKYESKLNSYNVNIHASDLLSRYLGLIAAGRAGVPEYELREILQLGALDNGGYSPPTTSEDAPPISNDISIFSDENTSFVGDDIFISVTKALQNFIITRKNLLSFFHPEFERRIKIMQGKAGMRRNHRTLAAYLRSKGLRYARALEELPYQLQWGEEYEILQRLLSYFPFLAAKAQAGMMHGLKEDFDFAIHGMVVRLPDHLRVQSNGIPVTREMIRLLGRAMELDIQFLGEHPQCLFQTLWNYGYWHDCPEASQHYDTPEGSQPPWVSSEDKLYRLVERWREQFPPSTAWFKAHRPLPQRLDSALLEVFRGHKDFVNSVAYHPDGHFIASGAKDHTVRIWDVQTGQLMHCLTEHEKPVNSVVYSPDGRFLASASNDKTIRIWDAQTNQLVHCLLGHEAEVMCATYSPDGQFLASGADDKTVRIWDTKTGTFLRALVGHKHWVNSVAYSPDGQFLATGSRDKTVCIWNAQTGELIHSMPGHKHWVVSVAYSPDGKFLASGSWDNTIRIWNPQTGQLAHALPGHESCVASVAYSPDGRFLASGSRDETIQIWDMQTNQLVHSLQGHEDYVNSVAYSPDGRFLASGSEDNTVRIWDIQSSKFIYSLKGHTRWINSMVYSPDGRFLASGSKDKFVQIWDVQTGTLLHSLAEHRREVAHVAYSPDGRFLVSGSKDKFLRIWDAQTGALLHALNGHEGTVESASYSPDGCFLASGSEDKTIRLWEANTGKLLHTLTGHEGTVESVTYSPDGRFLASGSKDKTVRIWDSSTGSLIHTLTGHTGMITSLAYSADSSLLISGADDNTVRIWDTQSGTPHIWQGSGDVPTIAKRLPYYALSQVVGTGIFTQNGQRIAFFPMPIKQAYFSPSHILTGYAYSYIAFLELCGVDF